MNCILYILPLPPFIFLLAFASYSFPVFLFANFLLQVLYYFKICIVCSFSLFCPFCKFCHISCKFKSFTSIFLCILYSFFFILTSKHFVKRDKGQVSVPLFAVKLFAHCLFHRCSSASQCLIIAVPQKVRLRISVPLRVFRVNTISNQ